MNDLKKYEYKIGLKDLIIIAYSGIRGAFPLILSLNLFKDPFFNSEFKHMAMLVTI